MNKFFDPDIHEGVNQLPEVDSKHCAQVLRHKQGDKVLVIDGKGGIHTSVLTKVSKTTCEYEILESKNVTPTQFKTHLIIAPTKNTDRMEWLIEKLCEIGVDKVTFVATQNSERRKLRLDRLEKKAISAMKQSGNPFLMELQDLTAFDQIIESEDSTLKLIAHVDQNHRYIGDLLLPNKEVAILIGPEGDFTKEEVEKAFKTGFQPVSLGINTLRTETAGFAACCFVNFINKV